MLIWEANYDNLESNRLRIGDPLTEPSLIEVWLYQGEKNEDEGDLRFERLLFSGTTAVSPTEQVTNLINVLRHSAGLVRLEFRS